MEKLNFGEMMKKTAFPEEPLDSKDRQLIQATYRHGAKGVGFNQLVKAAQQFASRSTVALRVKRLVRLGYLERLQSGSAGRAKPIRVSFRCAGIMHTMEVVKSQSKELTERLRNISNDYPDSDENLKEFGELYQEIRQKWNGLFGIVGMQSVFYGRAAAGDLFLPLVMEDFLKVAAEHFSLLQRNEKFRKASMGVVEEQAAASGTSLEDIRDGVKTRLKEWTLKDVDGIRRGKKPTKHDFSPEGRQH